MAAEYRNVLLAGLAPHDRETLTSELEAAELEVRQTVESPGRPITHIYFPDSGCLSVMAQGAGGRRIEVAQVG